MIQNMVVGIICTIFTVLPIYKLFQVNRNIKRCWPKIKCTPVGQLLFPIFGPKSISSSQNQSICDSGKFSSMFGSKISNVNNSVSLLNGVVSGITNDIDKVKQKIYNIEVKAINDLKSIAKVFSQTYQKIGNLGILVFKTISNLLTIFQYVLKMAQSTYYSISSIWNGPIGGVAKTFGSLF